MHSSPIAAPHSAQPTTLAAAAPRPPLLDLQRFQTDLFAEIKVEDNCRPRGGLDLIHFTQQLSLLKRPGFAKTFSPRPGIADEVLTGEFLSDAVFGNLLKNVSGAELVINSYEATLDALKDKSKLPIEKVFEPYLRIVMQFIQSAEDVTDHAASAWYKAALARAEALIRLTPHHQQFCILPFYYIAAFLNERLGHLDLAIKHIDNLVIAKKQLDKKDLKINPEEAVVHRVFTSPTLAALHTARSQMKKLKRKLDFSLASPLTYGAAWVEATKKITVDSVRNEQALSIGKLLEYFNSVAQELRERTEKIIKLIIARDLKKARELAEKLNVDFELGAKLLDLVQHVTQNPELISHLPAVKNEEETKAAKPPLPPGVFFTTSEEMKAELVKLQAVKAISTPVRFYQLANFYFRVGEYKVANALITMSLDYNSQDQQDFTKQQDYFRTVMQSDAKELAQAKELIPKPQSEDVRTALWEKSLRKIKLNYITLIKDFKFYPLNQFTSADAVDKYANHYIVLAVKEKIIAAEFVHFKLPAISSTPETDYCNSVGKIRAACCLAKASAAADYFAIAVQNYKILTEESKKTLKIEKSIAEEMYGLATDSLVETVVFIVNKALGEAAKPTNTNKVASYELALAYIDNCLQLIPSRYFPKYPMLAFFRGYASLKLKIYPRARMSFERHRQYQADTANFKSEYGYPIPAHLPILLQALTVKIESPTAASAELAMDYVPSPDYSYAQTLEQYYAKAVKDLKWQQRELIRLIKSIHEGSPQEIVDLVNSSSYFQTLHDFIADMTLAGISAAYDLTSQPAILQSPAEAELVVKKSQKPPRPAKEFKKQQAQKRSSPAHVTAFFSPPAIPVSTITVALAPTVESKKEKAKLDDAKRREKNKERHNLKEARRKQNKINIHNAVKEKILALENQAEAKPRSSDSVELTLTKLRLSAQKEVGASSKAATILESKPAVLPFLPERYRVKFSLYDLLAYSLNKDNVHKLLLFVGEIEKAGGRVFCCGSQVYRARRMTLGKASSIPFLDIDLVVETNVAELKSQKEHAEVDKQLKTILALSSIHHLEFVAQTAPAEHYVSAQSTLPSIRPDIATFKIDVTLRGENYQLTPDPLLDSQERLLVRSTGALTHVLETEEEMKLTQRLDKAHHANEYDIDFSIFKQWKAIKDFFPRFLNFHLRRKADGINPSAEIAKKLLTSKSKWLLDVMNKMLNDNSNKLFTEMSKCYRKNYFLMLEGLPIFNAFVSALLKKIFPEAIPLKMFKELRELLMTKIRLNEHKPKNYGKFESLILSTLSEYFSSPKHYFSEESVRSLYGLAGMVATGRQRFYPSITAEEDSGAEKASELVVRSAWQVRRS